MNIDQRLSIVELACEMFASEGLRAVRMDDIAQRAGVSKRTLYEEFADKNELINLAMRHYFKRLDDENREIAMKSPNVVIAMIDIMINITKHSETSWRLQNSLQRFNNDIYEQIFIKRNENHQNFIDALHDAVGQGLLIPEINMELSVRLLHHIGFSIIHNDAKLVLPEGVTPQNAFLELTINFMRGISTQKGIQMIDEYIDEKLKNKKI